MKGEEMERYLDRDEYPPNAGRVCSDCGSLVWNTDVHDRWHDPPKSLPNASGNSEGWVRRLGGGSR